MNIYKSLGIVVGVLVGIVISLITFKMLNKDKSIKSKYDERQEVIRGKSYRLGFYAMAVALFVLIFLDSLEIVLPVTNIVLYFTVFLVGGCALCIHSVWNGAYWGLNNKAKNWLVYFALFGVINLAVAIMAIVNGEMFIDGIIQFQFINLECCLLLIVAVLTMLVKKIADRKEAFDEES